MHACTLSGEVVPRKLQFSSSLLFLWRVSCRARDRDRETASRSCCYRVHLDVSSPVARASQGFAPSCRLIQPAFGR